MKRKERETGKNYVFEAVAAEKKSGANDTSLTTNTKTPKQAGESINTKKIFEWNLRN